MKNGVNSSTNEEIPKILWQTYKSNSIPNQAKPLIKSWLDSNPDLQWYYMDDIQCDAFIRDHFTPEFYKMYTSLPFGIMRSDVWRVAVVYVYGGIYADTDCECIRPIDEWISQDDRLVIGVEMDNGALYNCIFAAKPKHPALLSVLNEFFELYNHHNFLKDLTSPIQNFGQFGFSNGILKYYSLESSDQMLLGGTTNYYNQNQKVIDESTKFVLKQDNIFTVHKYDTSCVIHHVASLTWRFDYDSWRKLSRIIK